MVYSLYSDRHDLFSSKIGLILELPIHACPHTFGRKHFLLLLLFLIKCISSQAIVNINVEKKLQQSKEHNYNTKI